MGVAGGTGALVGTGVAVGGAGVFVGTGVAVGGTGVLVGTGVAVGGTGVLVGTGVAVGGMGVGSGSPPQARTSVIKAESRTSGARLSAARGVLMFNASPLSAYRAVLESIIPKLEIGRYGNRILVAGNTCPRRHSSLPWGNLPNGIDNGYQAHSHNPENPSTQRQTCLLRGQDY